MWALVVHLSTSGGSGSDVRHLLFEVSTHLTTLQGTLLGQPLLHWFLLIVVVETGGFYPPGDVGYRLGFLLTKPEVTTVPARGSLDTTPTDPREGRSGQVPRHTPTGTDPWTYLQSAPAGVDLRMFPTPSPYEG